MAKGEIATKGPHERLKTPQYASTPHLTETFVVEAVDLCDLPRFVVAPDQSDAIRVSHLKRNSTERYTHGTGVFVMNK